MVSRHLDSLCAGCPSYAGQGKACDHCTACFGSACLCVGFVSMPALLLAVAGIAALFSFA